jgi:UDP-3-O-[3-hydroxymyristoyl] glucosamine N-acyltransferase
MLNQILKNRYMQVTAQAICQILNGTVEGDPNVVITHPAKIEEGTEGSICFLANPKYEAFAYDSKASALLVSDDFVAKKPIAATLIRVKDVRQSVAILLQQFSQYQQSKTPQNRDLAFIDDTAEVPSSTSVGAYVVIKENAQIGENCIFHEQVYIGKNVKVGNNVVLYAGVKIMHDCVIGDNSFIHSNTVIGSDGFGFLPQADGTFKKVPQIGNVIIEDNVEIGANTVVDRATMGSTIIKKGVKLDNLIQIAHNVVIDENTVIAAQTGIAGSTKIGKNCMIGGQVGIAGHISINDGTKIQAQSGVGKTIRKPDVVLYGSPAFNYSEFMRSQVLFKNLPSMEKRLRELENLVKQLSQNSLDS